MRLSIPHPRSRASHARVRAVLTSGAFAALAASLGPSIAAPAAAQGRDEAYFAPILGLGLGGEADFGAVESDLELTLGGAVRYVGPLHEHFGLGGQLALAAWQTEAGARVDLDRNLLFALSIVPVGRYRTSSELELHLAVPLGLSVNFAGEDAAFSYAAPAFAASGELGPGVGYHVALLLGLRLELARALGLLVELGYGLHAFEHTYEVSVQGLGSTSVDYDVDLGQLLINLGLYFET